MKLLGILISFAMVGHVLLVTELDEYIEQVLLINDEIKQAKKFMPEIIKNILLNFDEYGSQDIAYMLSVPDSIDIQLERYIESDSNSDENIDDLLEVAEILSLMSHVPGSSQHQIPDVNLDPSTVLGEVSKSKNQNPVGITVIHLEEKLQFQKMMKLAILAVTDKSKYSELVESGSSRRNPTRIHSRDLNHPPEYATKGRIEVPTIKLENLASVLEKRRIHPSEVPRNRVSRAFRLTSLAKARREMTLEAITLLIRQNDPIFQGLYMMCRLVGAFRSIKYPQEYIIAVDMLTQHQCRLTNVTNVKVYVYTFIGNEFWEVSPNSYARIKPFLSELQ